MSKSHIGKKGRPFTEKIRQALIKSKKNRKGTKIGKNAAKVDKNIYKFHNKITGEDFMGCKFDFYTKYSLSRSYVWYIMKHPYPNNKKSWIFLGVV